MSKSTTRTRLVRAGLATGAVATVLIASGTAAMAANVAVTLTPTTGPTGGGTSIAANATGFLSGITNVQARFSTLATCPTTFGTTSGTNPVVPVTRVGNDDATLVAPAFVVAPVTYKVCFYGNATAANTVLATSTPIIGNTTFGPITAAAPVLTPSAGPATAGGTLTATLSNFLTGVTTLGASITSDSSCSATYNTTAPNLAATAVKDNANTASVTVPNGLASGTTYKACFYNGTTVGTSALVGQSAGTYNALPSVTLSPAVGPTGGTNTITVTAPTAFLSGVTTPAAFFTRQQCPALYVDDADTEPASAPLKISNTKAAFTVPAAVALGVGEQTAAYKVCVYNGNTGSSALIAAPGSYTIAPVLSVLTVSPGGGPAQGGSRVEITGTGFPTGPNAVISASIGGAPLTNIEPNTSTSFFGTTTARAPGTDLTVSVTTAAGTKVGSAPASLYDFSYGITVTPNTAPNTGSVYLDVLGAGFSTLEAGFALGTNLPADANSANPHVYLVDGQYNGVDDTNGIKINGAVDHCTNVVVISDVELICLLGLQAGITNAAVPAAGPAVPVGTYTVTVVNNGAVDDVDPLTAPIYEASIISSGSTFTVAPY